MSIQLSPVINKYEDTAHIRTHRNRELKDEIFSRDVYVWEVAESLEGISNAKEEAPEMKNNWAFLGK